MKRRTLVLLLVFLLACTDCAGAGGLIDLQTFTTPSPPPPAPADARLLYAAQARLPGPLPWQEGEREQVLANGQLERSLFLDRAMTLLETGNPFLERYNLLTGARVNALFDYGVPYFIGGSNYEVMTNRLPEYTLYRSWQDSLYYREGELYFFGFDCSGFTKWVWEQAGRDGHASLSSMLENTERHVLSGTGESQPDWRALPGFLQVGDLLVMTHPGYHVAMYIGTLRQFGYTEEQVPELSAYLDYPLVIHSGVNAAYGMRFAHLRETGTWRYWEAQVTDGGVTVSLLGVEKESAPFLVHRQKQDTAYFVLPDGTWLTTIGWTGVRQWCWFR